MNNKSESNIRRSGRIAKRPALDFGAAFSDEDEDMSPSLRKSQNRQATRNRSRSLLQKPKGDVEDGAAQNDSVASESDSSDTHIDPNLSDDSYKPVRRQPARRSAAQARQSLQTLAAALPGALRARKPSPPIDPAIMDQARAYYRAPSKPVYVSPPMLDPDRLTIDAMNVWTFAAVGVTDPWETALSCDRPNGGPRRSPPYRELYRLSDPPRTNKSDWAENIRWAKQQYRLYDSKTWTEYYYHLEQITQHRRETNWVSEEVMYGL